MIRKFTLTIGIASLVFILFWQSLFLLDFTNTDPAMTFGVSFAPSQAEYLGLDGREVYRALLDDLKVRHIRLAAYWNRIEQTPGEYDFSELDYYLNETQKRDAKVILAVGKRLPRWPECHFPGWANALTDQEKDEKILNFVTATVNRYKTHPALYRWQVENEPFLNAFGQCPKMARQFVKNEMALVKKLDPNHSTLTTDSGELATWLRTASLGDYFGSTVYRVVLSPHKFFGYVSHEPSIPAAQYRFKAWLAKKPVNKIILSEIQAEPWTAGDLSTTKILEQFKSMDIERFERTITFVKKTGFPEGYLWGVEWWYWLRGQGHPEFWDYAKILF